MLFRGGMWDVGWVGLGFGGGCLMLIPHFSFSTVRFSFSRAV
jgi:hypothetical protein